MPLPLKIEFQLDAGALFSWHRTLIQTLRTQGHLVRCDIVTQDGKGRGAAMPRSFGRVRQLEGKAYHIETPMLDPANPGRFAKSDFEGASDFVFNLSGFATKAPDGYEIYFNGQPNFANGFAALLAGKSPVMALMRQGDIICEILPAINHTHLFAEGWQTLVRHIMMMVCGVVDGVYLPKKCDSDTGETDSEISTTALPLFFAKQFVARLRDKVKRMSRHEDHWQVGYRKIEGPGVLETKEWPEEDYIWLPDDGQRYYADPFVFAHGGQTYLFVEEFRYASQKGVLAVATLQEDGTFSKPKTFLALPYHLSYPLVFEQDGTIYMMPETCANKTLEIWRAVQFPDKWVLDRVLMKNIEISDATSLEFNGETYLFGNVREGFVDSWGALRIYKGPSRLGPFEPVHTGLALLDAATARPGGHMAVVDGDLVRVVQDGRGGYGAALVITRVSQLDATHFEQKTEKLLTPKPAWEAAWGYTGVHTLNRAHGFEVIDVRGWRKKPR